MARLIFLVSIFFVPQPSATTISWKDLVDVSFEETFLEEYNDWFLVPTFGESIQKYDGKKVRIKGYIIPLDLEGKIYALSAYPFSSCFFCGGAGPESVMTLKFKNTPSAYKTDDVVTFEGKLKLNNKNPDDFSYVLNQVIEIQ